MDEFKQKRVRNIIRTLLCLIAFALQIVGHRIESYAGLGVQFLSLVLFLAVLWDYNTQAITSGEREARRKD